MWSIFSGHTRSHRQWRHACLHIFFYFFFSSLALAGGFVRQATGGSPWISPGFWNHFSLPCCSRSWYQCWVAEREKEPRDPLGMFIKFFHYSHCIQLSYFTLVNLSARPYSERITHTPLLSEGLLQTLADKIITMTSLPLLQTQRFASKQCKH